MNSQLCSKQILAPSYIMHEVVPIFPWSLSLIVFSVLWSCVGGSGHKPIINCCLQFNFHVKYFRPRGSCSMGMHIV